MSDKAIALSSILARGIPIEWHEGVSIVRALAKHLVENGGDEPAFPELTQIDLSPEGELAIVGGRRTTEAVRRLGQLLQAVLGQSDPPVQLRLFVTQATAPVPTFQTIGAFDEALAYYERPNRAAVLQRLFVRASVAPAVNVAHETTLDAIAPLPEPEKESRSNAPVPKAAKPRNWRGLLLVAGVVGVVVVAVAAFEVVKSTGRLQHVPNTAAVARTASTKLGDAVMSGISTVTDAIGLGRLVPADAPSGTPPAPAAEPAKTKAARTHAAAEPEAKPAGSTAAATAAAAPAVAAQGSQPRFTAYDLDVLPPRESRDPKGPAPGGSRATAGQVSITEVTTRIFSPDSPDVLPPVGVRPKLSRQLPPNHSIDQLTPVEILVGTDGTVESAKFLRAPRNVRESMLLSAVKAWQFQPASKDGVPVKYQKTVWIEPE